MSKDQLSLVEQKVLEMLEKRAIHSIVLAQGQFLSNHFLVEKTDGWNRLVMNLKNPKTFIPYKYFKIEGLYCLKFLLEQDNLLCKIDLKETYSSVPLNKHSQKVLDFNGQATYTNFFSYDLDLGQLQWFLQNY